LCYIASSLVPCRCVSGHCRWGAKGKFAGWNPSPSCQRPWCWFLGGRESLSKYCSVLGSIYANPRISWLLQ
jgi:hypothetical protein